MVENKREEIVNYLTVDVEDYFQVSAFEAIVTPGDWGAMEQRVERNTEKILELLSLSSVKATFFIVGWIAERFPQTVRRILEDGHEIGCHSYWHRKVYDLSPEEFREDTIMAKNALEDIMEKPVLGYRAPSYSITRNSLWALDILQELGFTYDSSIFPVYHDNYGIPDAPRFEYQVPDKKIIEYPVSTFRILGQNLPVSGGGYFRLFPYWFTRFALRQINHNEKKPFVFYLHPWEIDPNQPRLVTAGLLSKFRHYNNLSQTSRRLKKLLQDFKFQPLPVP